MNRKLTIKTLLREALIKKHFIGQCDVLRKKCSENEDNWEEMMKNKKKISFNTFLSNVDFTPILDDEEESPKQYIQDALRSDPETSTYISNWGNKECFFFQTAGFEFIFV